MTAEDFLNQYDPSNKKTVSQEPASSAESFLDQYDPSINKNLEEPSGFLRQAADIPIQFAKGIGTGTRGITDVIGADNPVSKMIAGYEDYMDTLLSAESRNDSKRVAQMLQEAKDGGFLDKISAGFEAFASAPLETTANVAGYMVPQLAIGIVGKVAQLGKAAQVGLTLGTGFAQGVGTAKGNIYQNTKEYLREQGVPEDQIEPIAVKAQSYNGENLDQLLLSGGLNALAAKYGAEAILTRALTKQGKEVSGGIIGGILKGAAKEGSFESVQSAQEEVSTKNIPLQRFGYDVPTFQGAIESATTGLLAGGFVGGLAGGAEALSPEQKEQRDIDKEAERRARELEAGNAAAQAVSTELTRLERGIDNKRMDLDALESTSPEASKMRLDIAADQKKLAALKEQANKLGLSETITEAEKQQIELAKAITTPAPKPLPTDVLPTETPGATYGREEQVYDVFGGITRKPVSIPKPAELPAAPTIEEQTAEKTYGGETGVFDVFAGARRKPVVTEEPPVSMVGKEVIPGVTPVPVVAKAPTEPTVNQSLTVAPEAPAITPAPVEEVAVTETPTTEIKNEDKLISENQLVGTSPDFMIVRDLYQRPDGSRYSIPKSSSIPLTGNTALIKLNRKLTAEQLIEKYPVEQIKPITPPITPAPVAETPAVTEAPAAEVAKPTGGIDYYKQLGEQDALDSNRKKKRAVPQNFKLAYEVGWSNARKKLRAEPTPAVSETEAPAAEVAPIQRDVTKPEQMTPEEVSPEPSRKSISLQRQKHVFYEYISPSPAGPFKGSAVFNGEKKGDIIQGIFGKAKITNVSGAKLSPTEVEQAYEVKFNEAVTKRSEHRKKINSAFESKLPVSAVAIDTYGITLPEGYTKQGDLYVYQPAVSETITPAAEVAPATQVEQEIEVGDEASVNLAGRNEIVTIARIEDINGVPTAYFDYFGYKSRPLAEMQLAKKSDRNIAKAKAKGKVSQIEIEKPKPEDFFSNEEIASLASGKAPDGWKSNRNSRDGFFLTDKKGKRWTFEPQRTNGKITSVFMRTEGKVTGVTIETTPTPAVSETITPAEPAGKPQRYALQQLGVTSGEWRTIQILPDKQTADAEQAKLPEGATGWRIIPETTEPEGISVGNRIKLGKSPQTYIVEEVVPQSEVEKANGEQYYSVKNEKTGEVQVVEKADMKQVKKSADTRKTVVGDTQYQTEGVIPEDQRFTEDELRVIVNDIFEGKIPDKIEIITDDKDPNKEFKAAYSIRRGTITYNLAYLAKGDDLRFVTNHELGHFILGDPKFQVEMARLFDTLPTDIQEKLKKAIDEAYAQEGMGVRAEETIVFAFGEILENAPDGRNILQRFLDAIRDAINRLFKTEGYIPRNPKKAAAAILLAARNKFERGEFIRRPNGSILMMTPTSPKDVMRDAEYLAAVDEAKRTGDFTEVQRMVDEAAKRAGYLPHGDFRDSHTAPSGPEGADEEVKNGDADASLVQVARGVHIQPDDYFDPRVGPRYYSYQDKAGMEAFKAIRAAMDEIQQGKKALVTVFRAVPNDIKGTKLENRDWVTPSKTYAVDHGEARFGEGEYRIIKESIPAENLFWDGNDIREWGKDDGKDYAYKNTKNNRKLIDPVTYDDEGNVIPLSQRFQPSEPDIRRMAPKQTPIEPEAKTITEGLVQGIDIGKENNMPINNKIESHIKNFAFVRGIFESASDRLRRAGFTKLATAIDDYYDQAQRRLGFANKILLPAFDEYSKQSKSTKKRIDEEVKRFFAAQENKRDTAEFFDELNPITQKIVTAWQKFGEESGSENQRIGIKVFDKGLQRWRPIGKVEKFWPRVLKPEYQRALMERDKYQKEYNEIVEALMKAGRIQTPEEADIFTSDYQGTGYENDYFSGIESARGQAFPEELYDYSTQVMTDYVARWAQHSSRIEQFGQKLGENSMTLWDKSRASTRDRRTIDYITAAQERVQGAYPNDPIVKGMATLNIWSSGLQLGNPASSMLNFFGGTTLNAMVGQPGALSSYVSSFAELRKLGRELKDAREKGIVSRDLMNIVGDHQAILDSSGLAKAGQKTADFLLKWSGFTPVEQMVRTQSMIIGKSFLRKTLSSLSKNPNSSFSKQALTWLNRNNIDADKLIVEQGTGPETDRLLRYFANISQGSYTIAQSPIFTDTPIGRFLFKYQKFSTQVMRQSWKNTFEPAWRAVTNKNETLQLPDPTRQLLYRLRLAEAKELGDNRKITLDEIPKKVTKAEGKALTIIPVMMWLGSAYVGGEVILRLRDMLFGVLMKGPEYEDIIKAFEDDEDDDELYLSLERAWYNLIGMGALGLIGNYGQFFMDWQDRERVKNPLDPPALSIFKETGTFIQNAADQGKITVGDVNNYLNRTFSAYRVSQRLYQTAASGLGYSKAPTVAEEMFRREVASINKYARRWASSAGLEYRTKRPMDIAPSKMTPINREIANYLQRGEPGAAAAYAKEYLKSLPKSERANAIQSMESGARNRQPLRLGSGPMDKAEKESFKKWLKEKVSKEKFDEIQKLDSQYQKNYRIFLNNLPNK